MKKPPPHNQTKKVDVIIQQLTDQYLAGLQARGASPKSISLYRHALDCFLAFLARRKRGRIQDVTLADLEVYRLALVDQDFAPASLEVYLRTVRQFFGYLETQQILFLNPAADLVIPCPPRKLLPVPSEEEMMRVIVQPDVSTWTGLRDRALLEMAYSTGARRQELSELKVSDVDLAQGTVRVLGKGKKERILPLGKQARSWLERYLAEARPQLLDENTGEVALWIDRQAKKLGYFAFEQLIKRHAKAAGVSTPISPHSFRRACATHMLRQGAHPVQLQMLLGHSSLHNLSQYLRLTITELKETHAKSNLGQ
jgi:integrase/recombinase XerD